VALVDRSSAAGVTDPAAHPSGLGTSFILCVGAGADASPLVTRLRALGILVSTESLSSEHAASDLAERLRTRAGGPHAGAIVRWAEFAPLVTVEAQKGPGRPARWHTLLDSELPALGYIHLIRRSKPVNSSPGEPDPGAPQRAEDWNWIGFFAWARIEQLSINQEDLSADPDGIAQRVVNFLARDFDRSNVAAPSRNRVSVPVTTRSRRRGRLPQVSIIVVSHNEGENLPLTISGIRATVPREVEIIVVDDWSTDDSADAINDVPDADVRVVRPAARGGVTGSRNAGAREAHGDVIVFADAHVDPSAGWLRPLCDALADRSVACAAPAVAQIHQRNRCGYGFTWRSPQLRMHWLRDGGDSTREVPFICGCLMAFRRDDFEAVGGFDTGLVRWGVEDAEIGLHLWRRGRASVVVPQSRVAHLFRPTGPYEVEPSHVLHNALRLATVHLPPFALSRVIGSLCHLESFALAYTQLMTSDAWERKDYVTAGAQHSGEWFVDRFRIKAFR
jgi:GT2 family glycosyltransferase